jgi:hypothetical protein
MQAIKYTKEDKNDVLLIGLINYTIIIRVATVMVYVLIDVVPA